MSSLLATTAEAVETAFAAVGDAVKSVTLVKTTPGDYDVETGRQGGAKVEKPLRAIVGKFDANTAAKAALSARAVRLYVPAVDFEGIGDPAFGDTILFGDYTYTIRKADWEGVKVLWEIWGDL